MDTPNQTLLARLAIVISVAALVLVAFVGIGSKDGGEESASSGPGAPVAVALSEFAISPGTITIQKGGSLEVTNNGSMVHNLAVEGGPKIADLQPGATAPLDLSSLAPGTYKVICTISGHEDSGMTATLVVGDGSAASTEAASEGAGEGEAAPTDHSAHDVSGMSPSDPMAKRINKELEDAMTGGVQEFLAFAEKYGAGEITTGNQKLKPRIAKDGTKEFSLTAAITDWEVSPGKVVKAWTYNGTVPGPWIRVEPGDKVRVTLRNELPISTDIHWHGISVPNDMDGVAPITQKYIRPYQSFTYEFTAPNRTELGMYHAHMHGQDAIPNGLFAVVQVGDVPLPRGKTIGEFQVPADLEIDQEIPMVLNDAGVVGLTLNGKGFPETEPIVANKGDWLLIHFYNEGLQGHPMHLHRQSQLVVAKDGFPLDAPYQADTIWVSPGERYSVLVRADEVGTWAFHCHIVSHAESDDGLFGMVTAMIVK